MQCTRPALRQLTKTNTNLTIRAFLQSPARSGDLTSLRPFSSTVTSRAKIPTPPEAMETVKSFVANTIGENLGGVLGDTHKVVAPEHQFSLDQVPDLSGKVAVVTGGSEGIGYGCVHTLLKHNISKLIVLSVDKDIVEEAKRSLTEDLGADAVARTTWMQLDLSDWPAVKNAAEQIKDSNDRIDILINQAGRGIMTFQLAENGVDRHMAVNHMGHTVLTSHLLPLLVKTGQSGSTVRIVNMASNAIQGAPSDVKFESLDELNTDLGPNGQYGRSKLAAVLYSRYLARHLTSKYSKILVNATHPGIVETRQSTQHIHEAFPLAGYGVSTLLNPFKKDQFEGCVSAMYAATATNESGQYICPPAIPEEGTKQSQDAALGEQLMKLTREVVAEKTKSQSTDKGCPFKDF